MVDILYTVWYNYKKYLNFRGLSMNKTRTRFAPSPTGKMHVGNLRTALYAFLITKHEKGDFILRIEDTDQKRYVDGAIEIIYRTLEKAGITYDEGPAKPGTVGPYVQSERQEKGIYLEYAKKLIEKGEAYYCFCDEKRLESLNQTVNGVVISHYDKHCLGLSKEEIEHNLEIGLPYVIRQNNPTEGSTTFVDELYGNITVSNSELDDMILIKSDGFPTYNFANVVDDHLMGITHIVRGNEYLSSSPKYDRLYKAFGWEIPVYVHCPLITDETHKKLSKRSGHSSFEDLLNQGFLPEAIINFVALLGWSPNDNNEIYSMVELIENFDYHNISKSPAIFDISKLRWMNGVYIKALDDKVFYSYAIPFIDSTIKRNIDKNKIVDMVKTRIEVLNDIPEQIDFFEELKEYDKKLFFNKKVKIDDEKSKQVLIDVLQLLESIDNYENDNLFKILSQYATENGFKVGYVMWPIRIALSGKNATPCGATEIMALLGKDESILRINFALEKILV